MIISIAQPAYLPWLGYFDRIAKSDLHIVLDHVQLEKGGFTNRTKIMQRDGRVMWLTIPVEKGKPINETSVIGDGWRHKHRQAIRQNYGEKAASRFAPLWKDGQRSLCWHCMASASWLGWDGEKCVLSSSLGGSKLGVKSDLVLNICKKVGASTYLSGPHGRDYLDLPKFHAAGIDVEWHDYPVQQPVLSAVHHLFSGDTHADVRQGDGIPSGTR